MLTAQFYDLYMSLRNSLQIWLLQHFLSIGLSLITDMVVMNIDSDEVESSHEEILMISRYRTADMQKLEKAILSKITINL